MDTSHVPTLPTVDLFAKSQRNDRGQFLSGNSTQFQSGNQAAKGSTTNGRPTKYNEEIQKKADEFFAKCYAGGGKNQRLAFIEALALELDIDPETLLEWSRKKNEDGSLMYPDFSATYKRFMTLQKLQLMSRGSAGKGQSFNQFLLSANHGMIPAEKQILAGDRQEPLEIIITEEKHLE